MNIVVLFGRMNPHETYAKLRNCAFKKASDVVRNRVKKRVVITVS